MEPLRILQIGCGSAGLRRIDALAADPRVRIVGLVDPRAAALQEAQAHVTGPVRVQTSYETMLAEAPADAAVVSTPHSVHRATTCSALRRGLHVLCEKPAGVSAADTAACVAAARASGRRLAIGANHLQFPSVAEALRRVQRGDLGDLRGIEIEVGHGRLRTLAPWFLERTSVGGGALRDCGAHALLVLRSLLDLYADDVVAGRAYLEHSEDLPDVEHTGRCSLLTAAGRTVRITATWAASDGRFRVALHGLDASLEIDGPAVLRDHDGTVALPGAAEDPCGSWRADTKRFVDLALARVDDSSSAARALWCARLTDDLYASASSNRDRRLERRLHSMHANEGDDGPSID